ncbi:TetR/AcrR family transcriptional regulator [Sphingopyxis sp.]|uniref:TetR/AcrR family transcriptional regulator n=1 Tax=Sphingopyxis sp. TaxID=1908224 RepID=UPI002AC99F9F|nr:TetR/AcrR family transcriptional regulator [Sphingopyxis sp.]
MTKRRGRPPKYDPTRVVMAAQQLFWRQGLEATTLRELSDATGLHKPSLYGAFGDRLALYGAALDMYLEATDEAAAAALSLPDMMSALDAFFEAGLDLFERNGGQGCFFLSTAVPIASRYPEIGCRVEDAMARAVDRLTARLAAGQEEGQLSAAAEIDALVDILLSTHAAVALRARAGEPRASLQASVDRVLLQLFGRTVADKARRRHGSLAF